MTPKNIVFFHAESWNGRMLGSLGHPGMAAATPCLDQLASRGTQFENAYCSHPICCPSRANMWSGRYTHHCESWNNYKGLEPGMWALFDALRETHQFQRFGKLDCMSGGHSQLARLSAWVGASGVRRPVFDKDPCQDFVVAPDREIRCHEGDWRLIDQARDFLREHRRNPDKPFFLYLSTALVHAAFKTNAYWLEQIPAEAVDIPPHDPSEHPVRQYQLQAKAWRHGFDEDTVRQVRRIYMAMCAEADAMVGAIRDALHELRLDEDTYFVFASDHGEMALEHQDWYKMALYEASVRVPMIISGPGIVPGQRLGNLVSLIDLCPTFMEMAGLPLRAGLDGESLMPLATGQTTDSRDTAYACFTGCTYNTSGYMLRKGPWKYLAYVGYEPQLFDIEADPQELNDLAPQKPEVVSKLDEHLRAMVDYEQCHRDWQAYCKEEFRQWRRQAHRGLHVDAHYGLKGSPTSDYWRIMDNCFTGYNEEDEACIERWLAGHEPGGDQA